MSKTPGLAMLITLALSASVMMSETVSAQPDANAAQQQTGWDNSYGGANKSYDTELLELRERIAPRFQQLQFEDEVSGRTMKYNLFTPADYDPSKRYPLLLFIADASTVGKGIESPLKQGYGGIIWATDAEQAKHPSFVLVPSFDGPDWATNDKGEVSDEVGLAFRLLNQVIDQYSIDKNRLYTSGQSMGGMISFYFNANHPDLFAASFFVGSQWDVSVLEPLADMKFFYVVSAGDGKASTGMKELREMLESKSVPIGETTFSAQLPDAQQEAMIEKLIGEGRDINFVQFAPGTVTPEGANGGGAEHMYSFDYAYQLDSIRDWLFEQTKD